KIRQTHLSLLSLLGTRHAGYRRHERSRDHNADWAAGPAPIGTRSGSRTVPHHRTLPLLPNNTCNRGALLTGLGQPVAACPKPDPPPGFDPAGELCCTNASDSRPEGRDYARRRPITSTFTGARPENPIARAAAGIRSMMRPRTNGPRSLIRTTIDRPLCLLV